MVVLKQLQTYEAPVFKTVSVSGQILHNCLTIACFLGHKSIVFYLLENKVGERRLNSALYWSALSGHASFVCLLLAKGANANAESGIFQWTPLMAATFAGHEEVVTILFGAALGSSEGSTKRLQQSEMYHNMSVIYFNMKWKTQSCKHMIQVYEPTALATQMQIGNN